MKRYLFMIVSLSILISSAAYAEKGRIKGFIFGGGVGGSFSADRITTEFLDYTGKSDWTIGFGLIPQGKIGFAPSDWFELFIAHRSLFFFRGANAKLLWYPFYGLGTTIHFVPLKLPVSVSAAGGACQLFGRTDDFSSNVGYGWFYGLGYEILKHVSANFDVGIFRPRLTYMVEHRDEFGFLEGHFDSHNTHNLLSFGLSLTLLLY